MFFIRTEIIGCYYLGYIISLIKDFLLIKLKFLQAVSNQ